MVFSGFGRLLWRACRIQSSMVRLAVVEGSLWERSKKKMKKRENEAMESSKTRNTQDLGVVGLLHEAQEYSTKRCVEEGQRKIRE